MADTLAQAETKSAGRAPEIRTLLTHVETSEPGRRRLAAAVALARRLSATLIGLCAEAIPPSASDPYGFMEGEYVRATREVLASQMAEAEALFGTACAGVAGEWLQVEDLPIEALARVSREADLIVAGGGSASGQSRYRRCDAAELVLVSGRPVLIAPATGAELIAAAVTIAWKDVRESRRALADALPFLQAAERVQIVQACEPHDAQDVEAHLESVRRGLARHGVEAGVELLKGRAHVGAKIEEAAEAFGADLIVTGGYGHTRMGEWMFGGVTRDLLHLSRRYLLMSH